MEYPICSCCQQNPSRFKGYNKDGSPRFRNTCDCCHDALRSGDVNTRIKGPKGPREPRPTLPLAFSEDVFETEAATLGPTPIIDPEPVVEGPPTSIECWHGDCLDVMGFGLDDHKFDLIITDLPYGTTGPSQDFNNRLLDLSLFWRRAERVLKTTGTVVMTSAMPFTIDLIQSNPKWFKYELIWRKDKSSKWMWSKYRPLLNYEIVLVFSKGSLLRMKYNGNTKQKAVLNYRTVKERDHPTQKPVELFEWIIKTYSDKGDHILDVCAGSGTTGVACHNLGRNATLVENFDPMFNIMMGRIGRDCPRSMVTQFTA